MSTRTSFFRSITGFIEFGVTKSGKTLHGTSRRACHLQLPVHRCHLPQGAVGNQALVLGDPFTFHPIEFGFLSCFHWIGRTCTHRGVPGFFTSVSLLPKKPNTATRSRWKPRCPRRIARDPPPRVSYGCFRPNLRKKGFPVTGGESMDCRW